jgi:hypothetical protein
MSADDERTMSEKIYLLHEITPQPAMTDAYRQAYMERYVPGARKRGMTLECAWMTPPFALKAGSNTLLFIWSMPSLESWWAQRFDPAALPDKEAWWMAEDVMAMTATRRLAFLTELPTQHV